MLGYSVSSKGFHLILYCWSVQSSLQLNVFAIAQQRTYSVVSKQLIITVELREILYNARCIHIYKFNNIWSRPSSTSRLICSILNIRSSRIKYYCISVDEYSSVVYHPLIGFYYVLSILLSVGV